MGQTNNYNIPYPSDYSEEADIPQDMKELAEGVDAAFESVIGADAYDSTATYALNDLCIYNNTLYICTTAITTAEDFTAAHWKAISVKDMLIALNESGGVVTEMNKKINVSNLSGIGFKNLTNDFNAVDITTGTIDLNESVKNFPFLIIQTGYNYDQSYTSTIATAFSSQYGETLLDDFSGWRLNDTIRIPLSNGYISLKLNSYTQLEIVTNTASASIRGILGIII